MVAGNSRGVSPLNSPSLASVGFRYENQNGKFIRDICFVLCRLVVEMTTTTQLAFKFKIRFFPNFTKTNKSMNRPKQKIRYTPYNQQIGNYSSYRSPMSSPPRTKRDTPPRLPSKKQRSQSLTPLQPGQAMTVCAISRIAHEKYCSADGIIQGKRITDANEFSIQLLTLSVRLLSQQMGQINQTAGRRRNVAVPMALFIVAPKHQPMAMK